MALANGQLAFYRMPGTKSGVSVRLEGETVWLTLDQMAALFQRDKSVISRHLRNVYQNGELDRKATVAKNATVQQEGRRRVERLMESYNLDAIISVGYRVNSKRGTQFRIWATRTIRDHLIQGYTLHERRLRERGVAELEQAVQLLSRTLTNQALVSPEGKGVLDIVSGYARSWLLLQQYDENRLGIPEQRHPAKVSISYDQAREAIATLKARLLEGGQASALFGQERGGQLAGILGSIEQSFGGQSLYPSIEEKAAHLLYFVIKDHPFSDGNKRIGSFLFILFLRANGYLNDATGAPRINDNALVALALLTAESQPQNKDLMIRLIVNLLAEDTGSGGK
jgi:prophage maintenance system killer protein